MQQVKTAPGSKGKPDENRYKIPLGNTRIFQGEI